MNLLEKFNEKYIQEFNETIPIDEFILNLLIVAVLVYCLRLYYIRFGMTLSNRSRFANNFLPLALGTLLIIMIVKSSIALSLGLVGALSIVRYRAAIKDPEELTYLFIVIGLGLAGGANQPVLAVVAFTLIILLMYINRLLTNRHRFRSEDRLFVNITTDTKDVEKVAALLSQQFTYVELKRLDTRSDGMDLSFICKADGLAQISKVQQSITALSEKSQLSIIDQPDLIV
ncbi:MAG: hypothetical protein ACI8YQ_003480 [Polaribacter sp.]|jgi:hypothetical protein